MIDPQRSVLLVVAALFGLCVGSFLNVVVWRIPAGMSVNQPGSHCPRCATPLAWRDNIPVWSWLALRARCRSCAAPISARYPLVECVCAALFVAAAVRFGATVVAAAYALAFAGLLALSLIDLDHRRLPDAVTGPTLAMSATLLTVDTGLTGEWGSLGRAAIGAAIGFAALGAIHLVAPKGMGFGDVKLAGLLGMLLGYLGLAYVPFGLFAGFVAGAVFGVAGIAFGKAQRRSTLPFGPFLAGGAVAFVLWGAPIVDWYTDLLAR